MRIGIIGDGAISRYVQARAIEHGHELQALILLPEFVAQRQRELPSTHCVSDVSSLPDDINIMIDCAGHAALRNHGTKVLQRGTDLTTVSLGALADDALLDALQRSAIAGGSKLHLVSGAIGALDCLRAARIGGLHRVTYIGRKPPMSWKGSPAENKIDLERMTTEPQTHFEGSARDAATEYPKNANVAAAVALAGIGFSDTQVKLVADPQVTQNIHEIEAEGAFGSFAFRINGHALPDNPRSSALAAMSVVSHLQQASQSISF